MPEKSPATKKIVVSEAGKESDRRLDQHESYEFGGPWGVTAVMIGFPLLMYYLWICLWFYDGQLVYPNSTADVSPFLARMWAHICEVRTT
jgi:delta24(24(1))-sterol reductase